MNEHRVSHLSSATIERGFRRTPAHLQVLKLVRDGHIEWRANVGPYGDFAPVGATRFPPSDELVALYELRNAELIGVQTETGRVYITTAGLARLIQWDAWRQGKAS